MIKKNIRGSGGGRRSAPQPTRAPDTLNSRQFATILDLLSEGEIEGFASPSKAEITDKTSTAYNNAALKDIFLDDTPVLQSSANNTTPEASKFNFQNVKFVPRFGTSNQEHIPGIESSESPTAVNVPVTNTDGATLWEASKSYTVGNIVKSNVDGANIEIVFKCTTAGQSGANEPTAFTSASLGQTITDNGVTWTAQATGLNGAVTRQISTTNVDAVKITISFPQLQKATDQGDLLGSTVKLKIQIQYQNGGFTNAIEPDTITGRTADTYQKQYRIDFDQSKIDAGTAFPVDIRVIRLTPDSTSDQLVDEFFWTSIGELVDDKQRYLNSAYSSLRLDSEQFSSIPKRAFRIRGIKVKIPGAGSNVVTATYTQSTTVVTINNTNHGLSVGDKIFFNATSGNGVDGTYTIQTVPNANSFTFTSGTSQTVGTSNCTFTAIPRVDIQTGRIVYPSGYIFNGTMGSAVWCSCPAMILLDLLTTERYGFGTHISLSSLDLFSFVKASRYANELVSDGFNGQEARFSCNLNIQGSTEAYQLINELAGVMRCFPVWQAGSISLVQDAPTDASYLFSLANVGESGFSYSGSSLKQRHSIISVSYFNMDSQEIDYEVVGDDVTGPDALQEDIDRQAKLGIVKKDIKAFACTSRGQARRLGKAVLLSEESETEVVTFTTSIDSGAIVRPGNVIAINDPVKHGQRRSGRINTATTTQITIDNRTDIDTFGGSNKKCSVILPDGSIESGTVTGIVGSVITVNNITRRDESTGNASFTEAPNSNSIWLLESDADGESAQLFRIISVEEKDGINYSITALLHRPEKYTTIDSMQGVSLPARSVSLLNELKEPPSNLRITNQDGESKEMIVVINNLAVSKLLLTWRPVTGVSQYFVQYRFNNSNWVSETVFRPDFELLNTEAGTYEFKVYSYNAALKLSATSSDLSFNAIGKAQPPANVQNLTMEPVTNKLIRLRWNESVDPDVIHGGKVYVRHSNKTDGSGSFQNSIDLIEALAGNTTEAVVPNLEGEYILKFRDDQGNFSTGETSIILDLPDLIDSQQILEDKEHTGGFLGDKTNVRVVGGGLELTDPSVNLTGTYDFEDILDLGAVFSLNLKRLVQAIGFTVGASNTIDALIPTGTLWDDYAQNGNFDGPEINDVSASMTVRSTLSAPSGSSYANSDFTNKPFNTFANGTFKGRGFQFRLNLKSESIAHNISIQQLSFLAAFESRTERSYVSGSTTSTAPLTSSSSSSGLNVVFGSPFFTGATGLGGVNAYLPSIGITIIGAEAGDYFVLSNVSGTGFNIKILDSSNNPVNPAKEFTFQAVGYGKGV